MFGPKIAACLLAALFWSVEAKAADRQLQMKWTDLAQQVVDRKISTVLTDGTKVEGRVAFVSADGLVVDVTKTSDRARFAGNATVPRNLVTSLRVSRPGWKWRVIGPIVGLITFSIAGAAIGHKIDPNGFIFSDGAAKGATVGVFSGAGAGYIVGHFADRHYTLIQILD